ncbi:MAG: glycine cleavage system protein R [Myxococcales bacterium]|nr:glycine cleavage system protein R [Myxococcales bacterium]
MSKAQVLVLTVIGSDRPGLVGAISRVVSEHGANWEASHMARLGGQFAGILQVVVPEEKADSLAKSLGELGPSGLKVTVERETSTAFEPEGQAYCLELVGSDQPNIVRDISEALASREVTVLELTSEIASAPVSGGRLFRMQASIRCPASVGRAQLRDSLEELANSLMVDLSLDD